MKPYFIVVGRSASGKSVLLSHLLSDTGIRKTKTATTRPMREGESRDAYIFCSEPEFMRTPMLECGEYSGYMYGTPISGAKESDISLLDPIGAGKIKRAMAQAGRKCYIIGLDCSPQLAKKRMCGRGDSHDDITRRIEVDSERFANVKEIADLYIQDFDIDLHYSKVLAFMLKCCMEER